MTVYIDIIIIENLIMNYIILYATGIISKKKINKFRLFLASAVGAAYVVIQYKTNLKLYSNIILKTVLSIIIVFLAFEPQNLKQMGKELLMFYLTSFTFGGVATYLIYVLKPQDIIIKNGIFVGTYILKVIFLGALIGTIVIVIAFRISKNRITKKDMLCKTKIKLGKNEITLNTMLDTGNLLKEPISGNPVVVVEKTELYELIPKEILYHSEEILGGDFENIPKEIQEEYMSKFKMIPFTSLGKQNGMLLGIKADEIEVINNEYIKKEKNAIIGIYNKALTKRGEYNALIGIDLY